MAEAKDDAGGRALELGKDQGGCAQSGCHWAAERNGYCWAHQAAPTAESGKDFTRRVPSDSGNQSELGDQRVYEHRGPGCAGTGALFGGAKESGQDEAHELVESALVGGRSDPQTSALGVAAGETAHYDSAPVAEAPEWVTLEPLAWGTVEQEDGWWCIDTIDQDTAGVGPFASKALAQEECDRINAASGQVSHESAWGSVGLTIPPTDGTVRLLRRYIQQQKTQQEQSEREVVSLQMRLGEALGMLHEADGHNTQPATWDQLIDFAKSNVKALGFAYEHQADLDQEIGNLRDQRDALRTQLTDANLKAEGLRVDNEELAELMAKEHARAVSVAAKLAESERKLGEAERVGTALAQQVSVMEDVIGWASRHLDSAARAEKT